MVTAIGRGERATLPTAIDLVVNVVEELVFVILVAFAFQMFPVVSACPQDYRNCSKLGTRH